MEILLTDDVVGVGDIGEKVKVKAGYARNFLIPRGLAIESGSVSGKEIAHKMRQIEAKKKRLRVAAESEAEKIAATRVDLEIRVGTGGKVFGSIGARDIADKLKAQGFEIDRRRIQLGDPIRKPGEYAVNVKLHAEVKQLVKVVVKAIAASQEEEELETQAAKQTIEEKAEAKKKSSVELEAGDETFAEEPEAEGTE